MFATDLKQERNKFAVYIEASPYGILVCNQSGEILQVNQAVEGITGYNRRELLELRVEELHPPSWQQKIKESFGRVKTESQAESELVYITQQGQRKWCSVKLVKLFSTRIVSFIEETTDRRQLLRELKQKEKAI